MLSIQNIRTPEAASSYFSKDNYYSKDTFRAEYFGEGARALSLIGTEVTQERFVELLSGKMAEEEGPPKHKNHRPGYDLTFSAPKSVSITALAIDDKQLNTDMIEAHRAAVDSALRYVEKNLATTRTFNKKTGEKIVEQSGNIIAVKFEHDTSRELDPQLHTHCVLVNATLDKNGEWKALNNEEFYKNKLLVGAVYRTHLAQCLREKGYQVDPQPNGLVELSGYSKEQMEHFSTRSAQIEDYMNKHGQDSAEKAAEAALKTRRAKTKIDRAELREAWREQTAMLDIGPRTPVREKDPERISPDSAADSAIRYAVAKLSERNSIMKEKDLLLTALSEGMGRCGIKEIENAYRHAQERRDIIVTKSKTIVTQLHLVVEKENIVVMQRGRGGQPSITADRQITEAFVSFSQRRGFSLSKGQQDSARLILTTKDRVVGIEGYAGTGKTTMLELVKNEAEKAGYTVKGYCPSSAAAAVLKKETGMETATLASHIIAQKKEGRPPTGGREMWVIDEASMVSTLQANELLRAAEKQNARIVFLGDRKQLASVEAGKPFAQLIDNGMTFEKITEIRRQRNATLKEAVYESMDPKKVKAALEKTERIEIPDQQKRLGQMAGKYLGLPSDERNKTLLLTSTNDDRRALNDLVRRGLQKEGTLTGPSVSTTILIAGGLTKAEMTKIDSYHEGQVIRFGRQYKKLGVANGDHAAIIGVDKKRGTLTVETGDGRQLSLDIAKHKNLELFDTDTRQLQKGDTIRFTKNDKQQNLMNGQQASVVSLDPLNKSVTLNVQDTIRTMNIDEIRYLDHAYTTTVHSSQGLTCDRVLANFDTKKEAVLGQEAFYVTISRAKDGVTIYTDNKSKLPEALRESKAQKSAIDELKKDQTPELKPIPPAPEPPTPKPPEEKTKNRGIERDDR